MPTACDIYPHVKNRNGEWVESRLFKDLLDKGLTRTQAKNIYRHVHSQAFLSQNGDWISSPEEFGGDLDVNGEPTIDSVLPGLPKIPEGQPDIQDGAIDPETQRKLSYMANQMPGVDVVTTSDIDSIAEVDTDAEGNPRIKINPELLQSDTVFHEYGHIFIEALGYDNPLVQRGIQQVKGTNTYKRVRDRYDLSGEQLEKEALATALGQRAEDLFESESQKSDWRSWLEALGRRFKQLLGIGEDVVTSLSRDLLQGRVEPLASSFDGFLAMQQKDLQGAQRERRELFKDSMRVIKRFINNFSNIPESERDQRTEDILQELQNKKEIFGKKFEKMERVDIEPAVAKQEQISSIMAFANFAVRHIESISEDFEKRKEAALRQMNEGAEETDVEPLTMGELDRIFKSAKGYDIIKDIIDLLEQDNEVREFLEQSDAIDREKFISDLEAVNSRIRRIKNNYEKISKRFLVEKLLPFEREEEVKARDRFRREYEQNSGEIDVSKAQYVSRKMRDNRQQINESRRNNIRGQLSFLEEDIGFLQRWGFGVQHVDDNILGIVKGLIDRVNKGVRDDFVSFEQQMINAYQKLNEHKGNPSNPIEIYEDILETDENGNLTGFLISKYNSQYIEDYQEFWENYNNVREQKGKTAAQQYLKENAPFKPDSEGKVPKDRYLNEEYQKIQRLDDSHPVKQFYDMVTRSIERFDRNRARAKSLGMRAGEDYIYELPHMRKTVIERFTDGNFSLDQLKDMWREATEIVEDDEVFGTKEVTIGVDGERRRQIPLFFSPAYEGRGKGRERKIDLNNQSFDVTNLVLANAHTSLNYEYKSKLLPTIDALEYHMSNRNVQDRGGLGKALVHTFDLGDQQIEDRSTEPATKTNSYELWRGMIEGDIFGEYQKREEWAEVMNTLMSAVGINFLGFNVIAGTANFIKGNIEFTLEALGGNTFDMEQWKQAHKKYMRDMKNMSLLRDIGINDRTSKTNQLSERFNALNDFRGSDFNFSENNAFKRMMNESSIYFIHNAGEHMIQHLTMYGVLDNVKLVNNDGEYIDGEGNVVSRENAKTLEEAFSVGEDGVELDEDVGKVEFKGQIKEYNKDLEYKIEREIWDINEHLHGAYSQQNRADAQRYWFGRMVFMMRKWLIPNFRKRFGKSYSNFWDAIWNGKKNLEFNQQKGEFEEGYYVTVGRLINQIAGDLKDLELRVWKNFSDMTKKEKNNLKRFTGEMGFMAMSIFFAGILEAMGEAEDDDEVLKDSYYYMAYQANRIKTELQFYYNPREALRILKDPLPTTGFLRDITGMFIQMLTAPSERYQRGRREGELKVWKDFKDILPVIRQYENVKNIDEMLTFFK